MHKIVKVKWRDANGGNRSGWRAVEEVGNSGTLEAMSIGVVLKETKRAVTVCPHFVAGKEGPLDLKNCSADGEITIEKKWIVSMEVLGEI